ncbi:MAG: hypothetical protein GY722_19160 [bacterium]|nr:hypothetical protein [bacterium]
MKNVTKKNLQKEETIESLLEAAGFDFTVVERCPELGCELCTSSELPAAA